MNVVSMKTFPKYSVYKNIVLARRERAPRLTVFASLRTRQFRSLNLYLCLEPSSICFPAGVRGGGGRCSGVQRDHHRGEEARRRQVPLPRRDGQGEVRCVQLVRTHY